MELILKKSNDDKMYCNNNRDITNSVSFVYIKGTIIYMFIVIYDDNVNVIYEFKNIKFKRSKSNNNYNI